jgi:hypothetical protein
MMLTNSWLEISEIKFDDFVIIQLMNELWAPPSRARCYSSAGRVRLNPGDRVASVDHVFSSTTESSNCGSYLHTVPNTSRDGPKSCGGGRERTISKFAEIGSMEHPTRIDWPPTPCALKYAPRSSDYQKFRAPIPCVCAQ